MPEVVEIPKMPVIKRLALAQDRMTELKKELESWTKEYKTALDEVLPAATFGPDKFLEALKLKGDGWRADGYMLIRTQKRTRTIRISEFAAKYKDKFEKIATVKIKDAEAAVGKTALDELCDFETSFSYKVVNMKRDEQ